MCNQQVGDKIRGKKRFFVDLLKKMKPSEIPALVLILCLVIRNVLLLIFFHDIPLYLAQLFLSTTIMQSADFSPSR